MQPIKFPEATGFLPATTIGDDGKPKDVAYYFYADQKGRYNISCIELTDKEIDLLKSTKRLYLILPGPVCAPYTAQVKSPFEPKPTVILGENGKPIMKAHANETKESPSDDK